MGIDRRFVNRLLSEIEQHLALLEHAREQPKEQLFAEPLRALGVQYAVQLLMEVVTALSQQLVADLTLAPAERDLDTPRAHLESGMLKDPNLANRLPSVVPFRELFVHQHWQAHLDLVYVILTDHLDDIRKFASEVSDFMETSEHRP